MPDTNFAPWMLNLKHMNILCQNGHDGVTHQHPCFGSHEWVWPWRRDWLERPPDGRCDRHGSSTSGWHLERGGDEHRTPVHCRHKSGEVCCRWTSSDCWYLPHTRSAALDAALDQIDKPIQKDDLSRNHCRLWIRRNAHSLRWEWKKRQWMEGYTNGEVTVTKGEDGKKEDEVNGLCRKYPHPSVV